LNAVTSTRHPATTRTSDQAQIVGGGVLAGDRVILKRWSHAIAFCLFDELEKLRLDRCPPTLQRHLPKIRP
jgi:hypothetical protein